MRRYRLLLAALLVASACASGDETQTTGAGGASATSVTSASVTSADAVATSSSASSGVDTDGDGVVDAEDACPDDATQSTDEDGDGFCDEVDDACPMDASGHIDSDGDGVCDESDGCPDDNTQSIDADGDGVCDELDDDCPGDPAGWDDANGDGLCDGLDDSDGDGISNSEEMVYGVDCEISDPYKKDTDADGYDDNVDMYARDPFPEYMLFRNDLGTIDLVLSNRDGTFQAPVEIGAPYGNTSNMGYRYVSFAISDYDNDGKTDFLAVGDADVADPNNLLDLWWFGRVTSATLFTQRLIDSALDENFLFAAADVDGDDDVDLVAADKTPTSGYIATFDLYSFLNENTLSTANCAYTTDPANPQGCAFVRVHALDLTSWSVGQWIVSFSRDAVDVNGDGNRDLIAIKHSSGGNSSIPVTLLAGQGDGTFTLASQALFTHNANGTQSPVNTIVFSDFNGDSLGDVLIGLDDDGDAGSAWFYPGQYSAGPGFSFNTAGAFESFDLNPAVESGGDNVGGSASTRSFDFDFDGYEDLMLGYNYQSAFAAPSRTVFLRGNGDGTFQSPITIRDFPASTYGQAFAIPQRLCRRFQIGP